MTPAPKRTKLSPDDKGKGRARMEESESESEDEWASERAGDEQIPSEEEEEEDSEGVAQFEDDEDVGELSEEYDEETALGKQLSAIPLGSLLKAKKKLSKSAALEAAQAAEDAAAEEGEEDYAPRRKTAEERTGRSGGTALPGQGRRMNGSLKKADRSSKHAPMEMSSKRAVGRSRVIVETQANKSRDPRFDSLSGNFKPDLFRAGYSFLAEAQSAELAALKKTAALARKNMVLPEEEKEKIEAALTRMESREVSRRTKERESDALTAWKKEEAKKRGDGKKEFYLKKGDQKAVILQAKYEALSQDKKLLRKTVEKKRRKTGQQEKKLMPEKRRRE